MFILKSRELRRERLRKELLALSSDMFLVSAVRPKPFVIVYQRRAGSNLLRYALEAHPNVKAYGEIFNKHGRVVGALGRHCWAPSYLTQLRDNNAAALLSEVIYRKTHPEIQAVGFKLYFRQHRINWQGGEPPKSDPWFYLDNNLANVKLLHLYRASLIGTYVSDMKARRDKQFIQAPADSTGSAATGERESQNQPGELMTISVSDFRQYCDDYSERVLAFRSRYQGPNVMEIAYEQMVRDFEATALEVQRFLGVPTRPLRPMTTKQERKPLQDQIQNFDELSEIEADYQNRLINDR